MFNIRGPELVIILILVLIIFGPSRLPGLARSFGKALTSIKSGVRDIEEDIKNLAKEADPRHEPPPAPKKHDIKAQTVKRDVKDEKGSDEEKPVPQPDYPRDA